MHESQKSNGLKWKWSMHTRLRHHLLVPSQYRGGGPKVKGIRRCGLAIRRRGSLFMGSHSSSFGRDVLLG